MCRLGLATVLPSSGTGVGDITYNHALELAAKVSNTPFAGIANSDIIFTDALVSSLEAVLELWAQVCVSP
jgi:hypothetical protein